MANIKIVKSVPNLVRKELLTLFLALSILILVSAVFDAPIGGPADLDGLPTENVKAPWVFIGIQQLLRFFPPRVAGIFFPFLTILLISLLPFLSNHRKLSGLIFFGIFFLTTALTFWGYAN
ncbi:MAG: hypothetical protein ACP5VS_08650 [Desulfomonilaceae bacterium]